MPGLMEKIKNEITFENVLMGAIKTPGVKINRDVFLRKELKKYYPEIVINEAIVYNPAKAGVPLDMVNKIAKSVVEYETNKVTALSFTASLSSSVNPTLAVGSATMDITSYFAHILRVVQELAYLYGFDEFDLREDDLDSETLNQLLVFVGVMFGVSGANKALTKLAESAAAQTAKRLAQQALTKGTLYPIVKTIAKTVGITMTKQIFADTVASAIPLLGSVASGGLTYAMFKPRCLKLRDTLSEYPLCNPRFYKT